jgi:hypothetical protein
MIDILSSKFTNNFCSIGSNNLIGGLGGKVEATIDFIIHWETINKDLTLYNNQIARNDGGSFITDGFRVGQTIYVDYVGLASSSPNSGEFVIINIANDILTLAEITSSISSSTLENGTLPFTADIGTFDYNIYGTTKIQNINFYFGLVENAQAPTYVSLLDGETQKYTKSGLDADNYGTYTLDIASSNKSWVTGRLNDLINTTITELGIGTSGVSTGYEQYFQIVLPFFISPAYLDTLVDTNGELNGNLFSQLAGANSLKFVYRIEAGTDNSTVILNTDNGNINAFLNNGDVGFYDQFRNTSTTPEYLVSSIEYEDANGNTVSELIKNATTWVRINLESLNGRFIDSSTKCNLSVYEVPSDFNDVKNNANTLFTNFDVSIIENQVMSAGSSANNNISNCVFNYISASVGSVTFDYLPPNANKKYLIIVELSREDENILVDSDGMTLLCDYNEFAYSIDLSEIYSSLNGISVNEHSSNSLQRSFTNYNGWIEDGVLFTNTFSIYKVGGYNSELDISFRNAIVKIEVENSSDSTRNFTLEEFTLLPPNQNTGRNFLLPTGDEKKDLYIEEVIDTLGFTTYLIKYATKLRWETWFTQANADPNFNPATKDWSEYITGDWSIKMNMYFNLRGDDSSTGDSYTFVVKHGTDIGIKTYDDYDNCEITGIIETFHEPTMTNLSGHLSKTANTFVRATFYGKKLFPCIWNPSSECDYTQILSGSGSASDSNGDIDALGCPELYGIIELDDLQSGGINFIRQISTMYDPETDTPFIGESGVRAKLTLYPYATNPCAVVEAVIDVDLIDLSREYKLSARIGEYSQTICAVSIFYGLNGEPFLLFDEYVNTDLVGFIETDLLIFGDGLNMSNQTNILSFDPPKIELLKPISAIKICCSSAGRIDDTKSGGSYTNASLIGLDEDDFLFFVAGGTEATTSSSGFTFTSGTGTMSYVAYNGDIIIDFKPALISTTLTNVFSYTNPLLNGLTLQNLLIIGDGKELQTFNMISSLSGNTIYFNSSFIGKIKFCLVNV